METNNNDDVMGKAAASAIENPEGMAQSLDNLKNTLQQLGHQP